jgi:hypothetical protein
MGAELSMACRTEGDAAYADQGAAMACSLSSALLPEVCRSAVLSVKQQRHHPPTPHQLPWKADKRVRQAAGH